MIEERRRSNDINHDLNVEFILKHVNANLPKSQWSAYINNEIRRFQKAIQRHDSSLVDPSETDLFKLKKIVDDNDIELTHNIKKKSISQSDIDHLKREYQYDDKKARDNYKKIRDRYINQLNDIGLKLKYSAEKSLDDLKKELNRHGIELEKKRKEAWKVHEDNVVKGVSQFLDSGMIHINDVPLDKGYCKVQKVGGGLQSDVKVTNTHNNHNFFIECKLDFVSSQYFKYGVEIKNGSIIYDHKRYIDSAKKNNEDVKKIDELFTKCINMDAFMKSLMSQPEVKKSWEQFEHNIDELCFWIDKGDWFDGTADREWEKAVSTQMMKLSEDETFDEIDFTKGLSFQSGEYPKNFKFISEVFDRFVDYYISEYNELIDYLIDNAPDALKAVHNFAGDDNAFDADDFKIPHKKMKRSDDLLSNELLKYVTKMQAGTAAFKAVADEVNADAEDGMRINDGHDVNKVAHSIRRIELKLNALLKHLGCKPGDYAALKNIDPIDKLKYFFQLFVSSTGRKSGGKNIDLPDDSDKFGNMVICKPVIVENSRLAQMITDFYVKKDGCAYIQIADRVYLFHEKHNPLGIEGLPIFKECMTRFEVRFFVSDRLDKIKLSIIAQEPDSQSFSGSTSISFVQSDSNFICKALKKPIEVHTKQS